MGTVSKALSLLGHFNRARPQIGLSDMTRLSGLNKATVHRLLTELAEQGFVEQVGSGREYRLGPAFLRLAALREAAVPMREVSLKVLHELSAATGETAHLSLLQGDQLSTLAYAYSPVHGTRVTMEDAEVLNLHATSSGLAVLAFSPPDFVDKVLSAPLVAKTPDTITDPDQLRARLSAVRETGIAEYVGGFEEDVHSHAVPIFDATQSVIGAVAVAAPVARMNADLIATIRTEVKRCALDLTRLLGGFLPDGFNRENAA
ncbi:IclR family transcriptional regulator [Thalassovita aquimarina]|uniref:IclR family transcriptional regulator n=1 Tax=Thalassovita aquimarina TaxID=2785917 RepID=A0ABS5HQA5_9RHOB|nr:IclR family transcriptional regulator [Thalassovita aquimarina]MBR9650778.1 IclR family transcriptional regulator [Thalassovita aquimarina]